MTVATMPAPAAVRERPILMSGPMVRAILAGQKTQTRRVVRFPRALDSTRLSRTRLQDGYPDGPRPVWDDGDEPNLCSTRNPFGAPGDRLWVRETWSAQYDFPTEYRGSRMAWYHDTPPAWRLRSNALRTYYRADGSVYDAYDLGGALGVEFVRQHPLYEDSHESVPRWVPAIHMPQWASRLTLEVTGVRVERVRDICSVDARAEGLDISDPRAPRFSELWDSLNAARGHGWAANPWVWVIEFRRVAS